MLSQYIRLTIYIYAIYWTFKICTIDKISRVEIQIWEPLAYKWDWLTEARKWIWKERRLLGSFDIKRWDRWEGSKGDQWFGKTSRWGFIYHGKERGTHVAFVDNWVRDRAESKGRPRWQEFKGRVSRRRRLFQRENTLNLCRGNPLKYLAQ